MAKGKKDTAKKNTPTTSSRLIRFIRWLWKSTLFVVKTRAFMEAMGIILIAFGIFIAISLATLTFIDEVTSSQCGKTGTFLATLLFTYLGYTSFLIPPVLAIKGIVLFRKRIIYNQFLKLSGLLLFASAAATLTSFASDEMQHWGGFPFLSGGILGRFIETPLSEQLGAFGTATLSIATLLVSGLIITDVSYHDALRVLKAFTLAQMRFVKHSFISLVGQWKERRLARKAMKEELREMRKQEIRQNLLKEEETPEIAYSEPVPTPTAEPEEFFEDPEESFGETSPGLFPADPIILEAESEEVPVYDEQQLDYPVVSSQIDILKTKPVHYTLPSLDLLDAMIMSTEKESRDVLINNSEMLINKLKEFNVEGRVTEVCPGPVITRYEFEPAPGIKISKIMGLSDDLAMGMRSRFGLRITPMPGKSTLGVEIPNQNRETVLLKDILMSDEFQRAKKKSILTLPLGKDTAGRPFISNLKKMPHLLIAGATGSGKSVCINTILAGLLFIAKPEELRLLLIDPKMLELSDFNGIPHLREPVITDTKAAPDALNWAVTEMERRYRLLADTGVRNIDQYNKKVDSPEYDGDLEHMPYLVIVIDELADLMITAASAVEESIQRLAQMARAAGIHLIIATQRPSVDVITGVIKANLPCRLAFQVASRIDSRTIIDSTGAEKLLGMGDCMFIPPGTSQLLRAHGAYVSESEVKKLVSYLSIQPGPDDEESIFKSMEAAQSSVDDVEDELYNDAVKLVLTSGLASISMLQRRLKVGHSRASRLIDYMELTGIVGPHIGSKPREILVVPEEYLERLQEMEESGVYETD